MREINFRAWDVSENEMVDWPALLYDPDDWLCGILGGDIDDKRDVLMQYTGLKDKNGVEIYEGDILRLTSKAPHVDVVVKWDESHAGFTTNEKGHTHMFGSSLCEVIGNIYENKDLLN